MSQFYYRVNYTTVLLPSNSVLSLTQLSTDKKELLATGETCNDRLVPHQHFDRLAHKPSVPLVVAGVRNVLSNLRCVAFSREMNERKPGSELAIACVKEEHAYPGRPYHVIICKDGKISLKEFLPQGSLLDPQTELAGVDWMVSGTPVCWDCDDNELFDRMISDAADHSHVWHLPRGNHIDASDTTRGKWAELQKVFVETLADDREVAASRLRNLANNFGLVREQSYLHSVWGVTDEQQLVIVVANGKLEEVGRKVAEVGCRRAICVENSGSSALYHIRDPTIRPWLPLVSAPNFRPAGTAFVFFTLANEGFLTWDPS